MTEKEKMLAGKIYRVDDAELLALTQRAHALCARYNATLETDVEQRNSILAELLPNCGEDKYLQGPIYFDYGIFTSIGKHFYANFNFTVLDVCNVTIGDNVFIGPSVCILTPKHPYIPAERNRYKAENGEYTDMEYGAPVTIGDDCWIAGNVTILAGAHIGSGCIIGAGSVVSGTIPDGYLAYGDPCKPVRKITEQDSIYKKPGLW